MKEQDVDSLFSATATATITTQPHHDVDSLFSSPASTATKIHYQETTSDKRLPEVEAITRILSPQPPATNIFSLGGTQDAQSSHQSVAIFDSTAAASQTTDVSIAESDAFVAAALRLPTTVNHYEGPHSPGDPIVSAMNNNGPSSFDLGQKAAGTKVFEVAHHQDSSSLFGGSDSTDASHFFSKPSAVDSSAFFSGLSHPEPSAAHAVMTSSATAKAHNDAFKPIVSSDSTTAAEIERTVEPRASQDMEPTPTGHAPVPFATPAGTRDASDLFGEPSLNDFASNFFNNSLEQGMPKTATTGKALIANLQHSSFDNLEQSAFDRAGAGNNVQPKESHHAASPTNNAHTHPVSLRESQPPPPSFRDVPSSQRHDKPHAPAFVQHSPENDDPMVGCFVFGICFDAAKLSRSTKSHTLLKS